MLLQVTDEEADRQKSYRKCNDTPDKKDHHVVLCQNFRPGLIDIIETFNGSRKHGRNGQEEGKLSCCTAIEFLTHTPYNGCGAPAQTRKYDRQYLEASDNKGIFVGDLFLVVNRATGKEAVNEKQYYSSDNHHPGNKDQVSQGRVYMIF